MVDLIDTNGVKPTLKKGVLGYDDYSVGGDAGRLYVGTGTESIAQAKKSEVDSKVPLVASTDNAIVRFDGTTGKVQNSGVFIDDNNNVGIGTSSPTSPLTVKTTSSYLTQDYLGDSTNGYVGIRFRNSGNTATTCFQNYDNGSYKIGTVGTDSVQLWTNNTERMRIDSAGNVGIGVAPSNWTSSIKMIDLGQGTAIGNMGSYVTSAFAANCYYNAGWKYKNSYNASLYEHDGSSHTWSLAPSGTAGNAITWTNAMILDANGDLSVGNSTLYRSMQSGQSPLSEGSTILSLYQPKASNTYFYVVNGASPSGTSTGMGIARHSTTLRSINAAGTINAAGADYAEYEYSNDINLVKGQIVGFKEDGTLTDKYSESIRFAIKSTNPSIVGGDVWGTEEIVGKRPDKPVKSEEMTDEEFAKLEEQYEKDLVDFEARLEAERQKVDRIAYAGKVPVNVYGAVAGQYVVAVEKEDGTIDGKLVNKADMTFTEYQDAVGRVNKILDDGRAEVAVIIH